MKIDNAYELAQMIELYKEDKITAYSLQKELMLAAKKAVFTGASIIVEIIPNAGSATNSTFGVATLPSIGQTASLKILIDKNAIDNIFSSEDMVKVFVVEAMNAQKILKSYSRFNIEHSNEDVTVADTLEAFLEIFAISIDAFYEKLPELAKKLKERKVYPCKEDINDAMAQIRLGEERLDQIMETLVVKNTLPTMFVKYAKELAIKIRKQYKNMETYKAAFSTDTPELNAYEKQRKAVSDGTYDEKMKGQTIDPNYIPETNQ